jgi:hypothetical protein
MNKLSVFNTSTKRLVVCAGDRLSPECAHGIQTLVQQIGDSCRFVMNEWLDPGQLREAVVFWVVDPHACLDIVATAMEAGLPILVPAANARLANLCRTNRCGLSYRDMSEALQCLEYLLNEDGVRCRMAVNAWQTKRYPVETKTMFKTNGI